jgi:5-histidylcysteine sulfoxide synthase/putative 4-mercaptohistidine N1-methyltranferase
MLYTRIPVIDAGNAEQKREEIRQYFHTCCDQYESLFETLANDKVFYKRPNSLRHPLIFYYGHTATFYINKLMVSRIIDQRIDPKMESMMAIGVDEMSWDDLDESSYDWPAADEVRQYRQQVRKLVDELITTLPLTLPIQWEDPFWIILMGIEHERIHLETSSVLIRELPLEFVKPHPDWPICPEHGNAPENSLIEISGGTVHQGRKMPSHTYGWDNEYGEQITEVAPFSASRFLVSNREFHAFVADKGYEQQQWWNDEGWEWRQFRQASHPAFWVKEGDDFRYRAMLEEIDMPWNWPVDVNYHEAKAFCNWMSNRSGQQIRLPTEAEWYRMYDLCIDRDQPDWDQAPGNINLEYFASASPVDRFRQGELHDVIGNVWQWSETTIDGFEGFQVHPAYDDFSVPTFDARHNLIKGGSWISTGNEAIRDSRYAFRRHFYQHAGFRYIKSASDAKQVFNSYETDEQISQYLEFHYGENCFGVANFPKACVEKIFALTAPLRFEKAFDIGCSVGRSSFELAREIPQIDALDFSTRFIRNAINLQQHGKVRYLIADEGELNSLKQADLEALGLADTAGRIEFSQGDACNLKAGYKDYDLIFAGNLIDRLYEPATFLQDIAQRMKPGGILVLTSPYTWLEEFTAKEHWLGGYKKDGENVTTLNGIRKVLKETFKEYCEPVDIPFVIRETARKHQHTIAQMTLWQRLG